MKLRKWKAKDWNDFCKYVLPVVLSMWFAVGSIVGGMVTGLSLFWIPFLPSCFALGYCLARFCSELGKTGLMNIFED